MSIDDDFDYNERLALAGVAPREPQQNPIADTYSHPDAEPAVPVGNGREDRPGSGSVSR